MAVTQQGRMQFFRKILVAAFPEIANQYIYQEIRY